MWNCGVLLLCVFVMVPQGALCKFTDKKNFKNPDSRGSSYRGASPSLTQRRQLQPRPTALTVTQANDFRQKLHGIKHKVCPDNETCASKCCPKGQGRDISEGTCSDLPREFNPLVKEAYSEGTEAKVSNEFLYLEGLIGCNRSRRGQKEYTRRVRALKREFHLLPNGSLFMESDRAAGPGMHFEINKYCIDWFITADDEIEYDAIICYIPRPFKMHRDMTIACILITCVLVLLRVVAFACLPELRTLHGKILLAYLISFFVALLLMVSQMFLTNGNKINREACSVLSFIVYFVTLLAFFWRNVMCYDIWWTFSGKRAKSVRGSSTRFCLYCAYAFGWPTVLTALMVALEFSAFSHEHDLMPKVWDSGCKGLHGYARLMYYYGPILTLFVINMVLFALTALKIAWIKKETRTVLKSKESGLHDRNNDVERFTLYANLFASMLFLEVNWILDSVTIFYPDARNGSIVTDFCNLAVLLFIFFNFVCKKRTWKMIIKRYQHIRGRSSGLTTVTSNNRTLTSQTSQTSQSQDTITTEQWNTAVSQNKTESCDIKREKSSLVESQEDNITNKYSRDSQNPDLSQEDIQPLDSIQNNSSPAESQGVTQSLDFIREKSSLAESQEYTQSLDFIRETSSPVEILDNTQSPDFVREKLRRTESQECTQSLDFIRENSSLADSQEYSQSLNFIREKSSPAESQEYNQSPEFIREKLSPVQILDNTQSPDFIREQSTPAESQECTQSLDFIREKSSPAESQANTQSPDFIREKSSPADSQEDTQSPDFIREKSSPAETQEDTQSLDFIHEKSSPSEFQNNTQSPDFSRHKTFPNEEPDDIQAAEIIVETQRTMARNALCQPTSFQRSRTLPRPGAALNHLNAVQKRQSLLRSSLRDPSINTDGATSSKAVFN